MDFTAGIVSDIEEQLRKSDGMPTYVALGRREREALSGLINQAQMITLPSGTYNVYHIDLESHIGLFFGQEVL